MLDRLDRVETLQLAGAPAAAVLDELRALVSEAEHWLAVEGTGVEAATDALGRCRRALAARSVTVSA